MKLGGLVEEYSSPEFATAVGLLLFGSRREETVGIDIQRKDRSQGLFTRLKEWFQEFF